MNFFRRIVRSTFFRYSKSKPGDKKKSKYESAREFKKYTVTLGHFLKDSLLIALGIFSAALGLEGFLLPNQFIDGGATGIALLLSEITKVSISVLLVVVNIPFLILGYNIIGKQFAVKAAIAIITLSFVVAFFQFPVVTHDKLLVAIFGGFFLGAGIGFTVRGGAVLDGTEVLAIALSKKLGITIGDVIIMVNIVVFSSAAYFLGIETALYALITYLAASRTLDFIIEGIEEYTGITIISSHSEEIRLMITNELGRGVTVYKGKRGYGSHGHTNEIDIIYTVITRLEISKMYTEIEKIDPIAFIVMNSIKDTKGGMIKKRPLH
jgi:uncharacterized membrane-anchored protein YitT (DUF2179 family)